MSPSDGSEWRQRIEAEAEHFLDVSAWSVGDIAARISANSTSLPMIADLKELGWGLWVKWGPTPTAPCLNIVYGSHSWGSESRDEHNSGSQNMRGSPIVYTDI